MKITTFQAVILAIFGVGLVAGVIILSITKGKGAGAGNVPVTIWGTLPSSSFTGAISDLTKGTGGMKITYVQKRLDSFEPDLLEALASGNGPDAVLISQDLILRVRNKITPIPYSVLPVRTFKDTFIQEGELYLDTAGVTAVPFSVDPLVMYWNRDLLANAGIAEPPATWDQFLILAQKLTVKDKTFNVLKSGVALGQFKNITNAKEIISAFLLQTGNTIVAPALNGSGLESTLRSTALSSIGAINFYTDFANPVKPNYSWNPALPNSFNMFASGDLAFYFGFASEISQIRAKNPNLNFDLAYFPQPKGAETAITFGKMFGLAILKNSTKSGAMLNAILAITASGPVAKWSSATGLPPVRRAMLSASPSDPYQSIFYNSAIRARGWLDPNPSESSAIFDSMIQSITSGEKEVGSAIDTAGGSLGKLLK